MHDIRHRVGIAAPRHRVYEMLSSTEGLEQFWTQTEGRAEEGGRLSFFFGDSTPGAVMEVVELSPDTRVVWRCVEGPAEWVDTTIAFDLKDDGAETVLSFTHGGWREPTELLHHCSTKWATFLIGLRSGLEGGSFTAFPEDTSISSNWR